MRLTKGMIAVAVLFVALPAVTVVTLVHFGHATLHGEARREIVGQAAVLRQTAQHLFETQALVLDIAENLIRDKDDAEIRTPEIRSRLAAIVASLPQTTSVWIADERGDIVAGSRPAGENISGRDYFRAQRDASVGTFVSAPFIGRSSAQQSFALSRRRPAPPGTFAGTIHVAISASYVQEAFRAVIEDGDGAATLVRTDGTILVRSPPAAETGSTRFDASLMRSVAARPRGGVDEGSSDAAPRLYAHRPLDPFPVHVAYEVDLPARIAALRARTLIEGGFAALLALLVVSAAWMAWRSAMDRRAAQAALREEVERRAGVERRLREAQTLEALGLMARGVAHDVNNLLTVVLGNLEAIEDRAPDRTLSDMARRAKTAAKAGVGLAANLLAYARTQVLHMERASLGSVLRETLPLLKDLATPAVDVRLDIGGSLPPCAIDVAQFRAAIANLVTNAREAMPRGGTIMLSAQAVTLEAGDLADTSGAEPGRFVAVTVTDTGTGMATDVASRAFDPFYTTKAVGSGSGLGLSQVFGLMHQLRGKLLLRTAPGQGTGVTLYFPVAEDEVAHGPPAGAEPLPIGEAARPGDEAGTPASRSATPKILVVEDQPEIRDLARRLLSRAGYEVCTAAGGTEALEVIGSRGQFDLLISDIVMPNDMDGLTLVKRVRQEHPSTAVVLMSGYAPDALALSATDASFVPKPFTRAALLEAVRKELA